MTSCTIVFGRTGCGKTSLRNMLVGEDPEDMSFGSGTIDAKSYNITMDGNTYIFVDTAGILDTRGGTPQQLKRSRADKVNLIGALLKKQNLQIGRVLYCVASTERILVEEIHWLADIIQMMGGKQVMKCFAVVLTKVDKGFQMKRFMKDFDNLDLVKVVRGAFPGCPVVTSGYDNVEDVKKLLVPKNLQSVFVVKPDAIKHITPKEDLTEQLEKAWENVRRIENAMQEKGSSKESLDREMENFNSEIDELQDQIASANWWLCPQEEIDKANCRIRELRRMIERCKRNKMQTEEDREQHAKDKATFLAQIKEANQELEEKKSLGSIFMGLLSKAGEKIAGAVLG